MTHHEKNLDYRKPPQTGGCPLVHTVGPGRLRYSTLPGRSSPTPTPLCRGGNSIVQLCACVVELWFPVYAGIFTISTDMNSMKALNWLGGLGDLDLIDLFH